MQGHGAVPTPSYRLEGQNTPACAPEDTGPRPADHGLVPGPQWDGEKGEGCGRRRKDGIARGPGVFPGRRQRPLCEHTPLPQVMTPPRCPWEARSLLGAAEPSHTLSGAGMLLAHSVPSGHQHGPASETRTQLTRADSCAAVPPASLGAADGHLTQAYGSLGTLLKDGQLYGPADAPKPYGIGPPPRPTSPVCSCVPLPCLTATPPLPDEM